MRLRIFTRVRLLASSFLSRGSGGAPESHGRHRRDHPPARPVPRQRPASVWPAVNPAVNPAANGRPRIEELPHRNGAGPLYPPPSSRPPRAVRSGAARARIREAPPQGAAASAPPVVNHEARQTTRRPWYQVVAGTEPPPAEVLPRPPRALKAPRPPRATWGQEGEQLPFAAPHPPGQPRTGDGRRDCGALEKILWRQWDPSVRPPPDVITAIDRLAEFPQSIKDKLVAGLDGIYVGPGGVPELDDMTSLRGVPLPSGRASWDACAGAYGERKIVIGSRPSPTPDVTCHEVGHALDDLDSPPGKWQSDSAEFRRIYDLCQPHLVSDFHRQPGGLGRKEFFADAFAAIASSQRPALVDMLGGQTRMALRVMLYFNRRYGL